MRLNDGLAGASRAEGGAGDLAQGHDVGDHGLGCRRDGKAGVKAGRPVQREAQDRHGALLQPSRSVLPRLADALLMPRASVLPLAPC